MKSKSTWELLINPFTRIAGWPALWIGLAAVALSGFIGGANNLWFDGVLDAHIGGKLPYWWGFVFLAVDVLALTLVMWALALLFTRKFRFIDLFGTLTLARIPMLLTALAAWLMDTSWAGVGAKNLYQNPSFIVFTLIAVLAIIWFVTLVCFAVKVSTGISGGKLAFVIVAGVLLAEIVSKVGIMCLIKQVLKPMLS